jgi:hypothetical protein
MVACHAQRRLIWGKAMRFLLKMAFWLGVILIILPSGGSDTAPKAAQVSASDAMSLAAAAATDMRQFCDRKPDACAVGSQVATALGYRAQAGAKMLYDFLTEQLGPQETGSVAVAHDQHKPAPAVVQASQNTLGPSDLVPDHRAPPPRKDRRPDRKV